MNRTDPTFKHQALIEQETNEFLDEMFSELFDLEPVSSDTDKVPDLSKLS